MSSNQSDNPEPPFDQTRERGIHNPRMIDLIAFDQHGDRVVLTMIEFREWSASAAQVKELKEKFNNYLDYVLDGYLVQQYPQYANKQVALQLQCVGAPPDSIVSLLEAMQSYAKGVGLHFSWSAEHQLGKPDGVS